MKKQLIIFALVVISLFGLLRHEALAWSAVTPYNTHEPLSKSAVNALDKDEYPDIVLFGEDIISGSSNGFPIVGNTEKLAHGNEFSRVGWASRSEAHHRRPLRHTY